jgi:hypothetical protein
MKIRLHCFLALVSSVKAIRALPSSAGSGSSSSDSLFSDSVRVPIYRGVWTAVTSSQPQRAHERLHHSCVFWIPLHAGRAISRRVKKRQLLWQMSLPAGNPNLDSLGLSQDLLWCIVRLRATQNSRPAVETMVDSNAAIWSLIWERAMQNAPVCDEHVTGV